MCGISLVTLGLAVGIPVSRVGSTGPAPGGRAVANLASIPTSGAAPLAVSFNGSMSSEPGGTIASWDLCFGDGTGDTSGTGAPPSTIRHTYKKAGIYDAILTVTGVNGSTGKGAATVVVNAPTPAPPVAQLAASTGSGIAPLSVRFYGSAERGTISSWVLSFGDGMIDATGSGPLPSGLAHTYTSLGVHTAVLTVHGANGQRATATAQVGVAVAPPKAELAASTGSGIAPLDVRFDGSATSDPDGTIRHWQLTFGDGTIGAAGSGPPPSSVPHAYPASGAFTATLTVVDSNNQRATATARVVVAAPPTPTTSSSAARTAAGPTAQLAVTPGSGNAPLPVRFVVSATAAPGETIAGWTLSFGDGTPDTVRTGPPVYSIHHSYLHPGTFTATVTVKDSAGLTASATAQVAVAPTPPIAQLAVNPGSGVAPLAVTFDGSASSDPDGTITTWDLAFGDGTTDTTGSGTPPSGIPHTYTTAGPYTATLTVQDSNGLSATATAQITVASGLPVAGLSATPANTAQGIHKIKHVIMIMQENRSFDNYFGTYPGAAGIPMQNGVPTVCVPDPNTGSCDRPYHDTTQVNTDAPHGLADSHADIDKGKMDGFITQAEIEDSQDCGKSKCIIGPGDVMGYHTAAEIPNYWQYAEHFVLNDHMFESNLGFSFASHLGLVSLWAAACSKAGDPTSCVSNANPPRSETEFPWTDLTWLLHGAGVSWQYFVGTGGTPDCTADPANCEATSLTPQTQNIWNPLPGFDDVSQDGQLGNIVSTASFYPEARNGTLPAVSWVVPGAVTSEHAPAPMDAGEAYVTGLINSVMEGPDWNSTAIFETWDDWGGLYDNAVPPVVDSIGYGLRVPGLVISPYAVAGKVDHQVLSSDAYAKFIEDDFLSSQRLDPATDGRPDPRPDVRENVPVLGDLQNDFNFNQTPIAPFVLNSGPPWGPVANPQRLPDTIRGVAPLNVTFDGSTSSGPITSWDLSFGDGTPDASGTGVPPAVVAHTYSNRGSFTATLTVFNAAGLSNSASDTIQVGPVPPVPSLTANPPGGIAPLNNVVFDGAGTTVPRAPITSWKLDFGDGSPPVIGTGAPPVSTAVHSFPEAGTYGVTLTVTDANGTSAVAPYTLLVQPRLGVNPSIAPPSTSTVVIGAGFLPLERASIFLDGQSWGTATVHANGQFASIKLLIPATMQPGLYTVSVVGQSSGITAAQTLNVSTGWQFRNSASGGSVNPYENTISVGNVATLVPALGQGFTEGPILSSPAVHDQGLPTPANDGSEVHEQLIAVGSNDDSVHTWYASSSEEVWNLPTKGPVVSSPFFAKGGFFVGSEDGSLYEFPVCPPPNLGKGSGKVSQCKPTMQLALGSPIESSPVGQGTTVYVGADNGDLYAVSSKTKSILWSTPLGGPVTSTPALSGTTVVVGAGNNVYGVDAGTGAVLWTAVTGGTVSSSPAIANNVVYVGSGDGNLYAYPLSCSAICTPLWSATTAGGIASSPALADGLAVVGSDDGNLYAFDTSTHALVWKMTTGGPVKSSPAVANGVVYVGSSDAKVYAVALAGCGGPTTCPPLWSATTGGPVASSPAVANGRIYVGSGDGRLYSYVLPTAPANAPR